MLSRFAGNGYKKVQGSMTIEAAYLMPMLVFLIWNILYLAIFLYDQCVILQGSYTSALRAERLVGTIGEKESLANTKYEIDVKERVVCAKVQKEQSIQKEGVSINTIATMKAPGSLFFQSSWSGKHSQKAERFEPVQFIRNCRKVSDIRDLIGEK